MQVVELFNKKKKKKKSSETFPKTFSEWRVR